MFPIIALSLLLFGQLGEFIFTYPAKWARPILRQIFETGTRQYLPFPVSLFWIINIPAIWTLTLPHSELLF
jgi:hypothetical protein